jgi:hypothetical protein
MSLMCMFLGLEFIADEKPTYDHAEPVFGIIE